MAQAPKIVSLQDIADVVGVHKTTVHRALHNDPRVESGTAARILAIAGQLGYDPNANQAARQLSLRKSGRREPNRLIALMFPVVFTRGPYFMRPYLGFMETLGAAGYDVLARCTEGKSEDRLPAPVLRGDADAVVALAGPEWLARQVEAMSRMLPSARRPLVAMINPTPGAWHVSADFRQGGRLAMGHLLDLGHRRIIAICGLSNRSDERASGYREEAVARGLDPDRCLVMHDGMSTERTLRERIATVLDLLLARAPDATAFLAPNDEVAILALELLAERGRPVPGRMSLVGFDDTHVVPGPDHRNILTTIALPLEQLGRETALMAMAPGDEPRTVILPVGLRVRGTTRAVAG